jgi:uncharacterized BrkB/YihY/UPF0761 family membrane protein
VYYSAQIFYFGAEFTHVIAESRRGTLESPHQAASPKEMRPPVRTERSA